MNPASQISDSPGPCSGRPAAACETAAFRFQEGILELASPLPLHHGGELSSVRIAWRLTGPANAPVVAALGGISAGRAVADANGQQGWWRDIIGEGAALDTRQYQVLGLDFLGGSADSTGPRAGQQDFPAIASQDQAQALLHVLDHLGIDQLAGIIGASYGGMVALAFAQRWPQRVAHIVVISAAHRSNALATGWRSVQRATVRFALNQGAGPEGLRLARALAMTTYRSATEFAQRFGGRPQRVDGRFQFPIESYLLARGDAYAEQYLPESFLCLSESIDLHEVQPEAITVPVSLVAVVEDQLVTLADMRQLEHGYAGPARLYELSSLYGHDAFLKETQALGAIFQQALGPASHAIGEN